MDALALGLVAGSGLVHAGWNLLAKRVGGEVSFVWLNTALSSLMYAPVAIWATLTSSAALSASALAAIVVSSLIHSVYSVLLQKTYGIGDLSLVYPLARGTGPLLVGVGAVLFLGERPTRAAVTGTILISAGIVILACVRNMHVELWQPVVMALFVGVLIACYTLWDGYAVAGMAIAPVLLKWGTDTCRAVWLAPLAFKRRRELNPMWHRFRKEVVAVAILGPFGYILFLLALIRAPASSVAPLREVGVVVAAFLGGRYLAESEAGRRLGAAVLVAAGIGVIGLS